MTKVPAKTSWMDEWATQPTPTGVSYDEVLTGEAKPWMRSGAGILTGLLLYMVLAVSVSQFVNWLGWLILRPGGTFEEWQRANAAYQNPWGMLAGHLGLAMLIPISLAVVLFVHRRRPQFLCSVRPLFRWRYLLISMALALVVLNLFLYLQNLGGPFPTLQPQAQFWGFLVVILLVTPLQATAEEFFFRGYLLQAFHSLAPRSPWFGVVTSAALFALFHGTQNLPLFLDRFAFGVLVGVLVVKTGGLEAAIGAHIINNVMAFTYAALTTSIAQVAATQNIGWAEFGWDVARYGVLIVLAILVAKRMNLATLTPGVRPSEPIDPWEPKH